MRRIGIFGWGIVAPNSPNIETFARNLETSESWLEPFDGFGPNNFLVGVPDFSLEDYRQWLDERFGPSRIRQLRTKLGKSTWYAIGAFIQALQQNSGVEEVLQELGTEAHVYVGTCYGDLGARYDESMKLRRAQRRWDRFWASPDRNSALREYLALSETDRSALDKVPPAPESLDDADEREEAEDRWWSYWAGQSDALKDYLEELRRIEAADISGDVEADTFAALKERRKQSKRLAREWKAPTPPWETVPASVLYDIPTMPASQISMIGRITGLVVAPVAACATFAVALKQAVDAIRYGTARAVVVGATEPPPHPLTVGSFYDARVLSADYSVSKPLTGLRGTHLSGGSAVWIVGDMDFFTSRGLKPLGMEPLVVGASADAEHIITPSAEGPLKAIRQALTMTGVDSREIGTWDVHATGTPGDYAEITNLRRVVPDQVWVTAYKGTFGHGIAVASGWELTAQYLGVEKRRLYPTLLTPEELNREIEKVHQRFVFSSGLPLPAGVAGKLSMGIGGINACVISRPLAD